MAKTATLPTEDTAAESADLMVMATVNPLTLFTDREQFSQFYKRVKEETDKHVADVSTQKGRDAVRSLARKVTTAKTTLDKAGKGLVEEMRQQVNSITSVRIQMVDEMDALAKEVRRPLTEWENAEKERVERCQAVIDDIKVAAVVSLEDTSETVRARGKELWATEIGEEFGDMTDAANEVKATAIATLQRALERLTKEEADRAELEALRAAQAEREERDRAIAYQQSIIQHCRDCGSGIIGGQSQSFGILFHELEVKVPLEQDGLGDLWHDVDHARIEALARVREVQEKHEAETRRQAEEAEAARIREAEERAAQAARDEADRAAREVEAQREREHEAALAEERRQREDAERVNREAEAREAQRLEDERLAAAEEARRAKNRAHRAQIMGEVKISIMAAGQAGEHPVTEAAAVAIVRAIAAGSIPHVSLAF